MPGINNSASRVRQHRQAMRAAGMRPIQIWVPDTRQPGFSDEAARQSRRTAAVDQMDASLDSFLDSALADLAEPENTDHR